MKYIDRTAKWMVGGLAAAVALGGLGVVSAGTSGPAPAFTAISPCRLIDTRPGDVNVGPRSTPLQEAEEVNVKVHGANGRCSIPASATAITANVVAVGPSAPSFLSIWPADTSNPGTSSLNYVAGQAPTPNTISVALSAAGSITLFNRFGTVDVVIDISGYYADHTHDDRYSTKTEIDSALNTKANTSSVYTRSQVDAKDAVKANSADVYTKSEVYTQAEVEALVLPTTYIALSIPFTCSVAGGTCAAGGYAVAALCAVDDDATGGSAVRTPGGSSTEEAHPSRPLGTAPQTAGGWQASNQVALPDGTSVTAYAICASLPTS